MKLHCQMFSLEHSIKIPGGVGGVVLRRTKQLGISHKHTHHKSNRALNTVHAHTFTWLLIACLKAPGYTIAEQDGHMMSMCVCAHVCVYADREWTQKQSKMQI